MLINDDWMFSPIGWVDAWYYVGYGLKYNDPSFLDTYYKISRLPWILIEYIFRSNFDYYHASVMMQLMLMMGTIFALYMALLRTLGRVGAFFGTLFYATYTLFLRLRRGGLSQWIRRAFLCFVLDLRPSRGRDESIGSLDGRNGRHGRAVRPQHYRHG